jgi:hypothetical protein
MSLTSLLAQNRNKTEVHDATEFAAQFNFLYADVTNFQVVLFCSTPDVRWS